MTEDEIGTIPSGAFSEVRVPFDDVTSVHRLTEVLGHVWKQAQNRKVIVVCVGTDRSTGDSFGPIVGSKLLERSGLGDLDIYGTLNEPVHAVNLAATLQHIHSSSPDHPFVLAVDACLGKFDHVGQIIVEPGPLRPGAGVKKSLPAFGDVTVTGVVNVCGFMEYFVLQNTRLGIVMRMTDVVVEAIHRSWMRTRLQRTIVGAYS